MIYYETWYKIMWLARENNERVLYERAKRELNLIMTLNTLLRDIDFIE